MLNSQSLGVILKLSGGKGSQKDVCWLFNYQVVANHRLCLQELFDLFHNLNAVFNWHLEVKNQQVYWFVYLAWGSLRGKTAHEAFLDHVNSLLSIECILN